jgi:hypothetical protein
VLDVCFNEDQCRIRKGNAPENIAIVRHIALNMLKGAQTLFKGHSIKALRQSSRLDNEAINLILQQAF